MTFALMSVVDLKNLHQKIQKPIFVRFPKNSKQVFIFNNTQYCHKYKGIILYNEYKTVETTVEELLVEMTYQTYELRRLQNDSDYELALTVYEQYFSSTPDSEESRFAYLLSLVILDYEAQHYPIGSTSTIDFIDYLLEERQQTWCELRKALGYGDSVDISYIQKTIEEERTTHDELRRLSHFFRLPVGCFIQGGYE